MLEMVDSTMFLAFTVVEGEQDSAVLASSVAVFVVL